MHKLVLILAMVILTPGKAAAEEIGHDLGFVIPYDRADFTEKEKELYVSGVVDGEIFMLYGASSPEMDPFLKCVKKEGIKSLVRFTELQLGFGENINDPMPWSISKGVGMACKKYREK